MLPDDLPEDMPSFLARFGTDEQCREYLFKARWPDGFRCAACGHDDAYALRTKIVYECVACRKQHSLARRHHLRADQDRPGQVVPGHLPGDLQQGRDRRHRAAAAAGLGQLPDRLDLAAQAPQGHGPPGSRALGRARRGRRDLVSDGRLGSLPRHEAGSARTRRETTSLRRRWRARPRHRALAEIGRYRRPPLRDEPASTRWIGARGRFAQGRAPWCFSASTYRRAGWIARSWPMRAAALWAGGPSRTTPEGPNGPRAGRRASPARPRPTRT